MAVLATLAGRYLPDYLAKKESQEASTTPLVDQSMFNNGARDEEHISENFVDLVAS